MTARIRTQKASMIMLCTVMFWMKLTTTNTRAAIMMNSPRFQRESTRSRMKRRWGPLSRRGR